MIVSFGLQEVINACHFNFSHVHVIDFVLPTVLLVAEFLVAISVHQFVCAAVFVQRPKIFLSVPLEFPVWLADSSASCAFKLRLEFRLLR